MSKKDISIDNIKGVTSTQSINTKKGLISKLNEKPLKYFTQGILTFGFITDGINAGMNCGLGIYEHKQQIKEFVGDIGYMVAQIGVPVFELASFAAIGYIAVKGTGMYFDQTIYENSETKSSHT
jgi:hypothetical protein